MYGCGCGGLTVAGSAAGGTQVAYVGLRRWLDVDKGTSLLSACVCLSVQFAGLPAYIALMRRCWHQDPAARPAFADAARELRRGCIGCCLALAAALPARLPFCVWCEGRPWDV